MDKEIVIKRHKGSSLFTVTKLQVTSELALRLPDLKEGDVVEGINGRPIRGFYNNKAVSNYIKNNDIWSVQSVSLDIHKQNVIEAMRERELAVISTPEKRREKSLYDKINYKNKLAQLSAKPKQISHIIPFTELGLETPTGPTSKQLENYTKAVDDREIILAYHAQFPFGYHITTVSPKIFMDFSDSNTDSSKQLMSSLEAQIRNEIVTQADICRMIENFTKRLDINKEVHGCACCGVRDLDPSIQYIDANIEELGVLIADDWYKDWLGRLGEYSVIASHYNYDSEIYHLHEECCHGSGVMLCSKCNTSLSNGNIPFNSLKKGHDYGDFTRHPGLKPLSLVERQLISHARQYASIIKIKQGERDSRILTGHVISFLHDGPQQAATIFPDVEGVKKSITIMFVGENGSKEFYNNAIALHELRVDPTNVYEWIKALKRINPLYKYLNVDTSENMKNELRALPQFLLNDATIIDDVESRVIESLISDDVAQVSNSHLSHHR